MKNVDRMLGMLFALPVLAVTVIVLISLNASWLWVLSFLLIFILWVWYISGWKKVEIGWRCQILYLGERQSPILNEGWRWAPFPFSINKADCRAVTTKLDKINVFTLDSVEMTIKELAIVWQIFNLDAYFNMDPKDLKTLLDDVVDKIVRKQVRENNRKEILGMNLGTEKVETSDDLQNFGIRVIRIIVPEIVPTNPDMLKDIEARAREDLEKRSQRIEMEHFGDLVKELMKPKSENGPGLTQEQAFEQAQLLTEKAEKKISGFTLNSDALKALSGLLGRKP